MVRFRIHLLILLITICWTFASCGPLPKQTPAGSRAVNRVRRQFSMNFGATHQQDEGTDVTAEAIARLWRSKTGNTEVQGSASYNQHFGGFQGDGKAKISGMLTLTHNY